MASPATNCHTDRVDSFQCEYLCSVSIKKPQVDSYNPESEGTQLHCYPNFTGT